MNKTKLTIIVAVFLCWSFPLFAQTVHFQENFRNYCDRAPGVTEDNGITVDNEPIWDWAHGAKLCVRAKRSGMVYKEAVETPELARFDLSLRFAFLNDTPGVFSVMLLATQHVVNLLPEVFDLLG